MQVLVYKRAASSSSWAVNMAEKIQLSPQKKFSINLAVTKTHNHDGMVPPVIIAERSEANNRDLRASESQLAFIHIYGISPGLSVTLPIVSCPDHETTLPRPHARAPSCQGGKSRVQNGAAQ